MVLSGYRKLWVEPGLWLARKHFFSHRPPSVSLMSFRTFIMLESQHVWYIPRPFSLGWHVGCKSDYRIKLSLEGWRNFPAVWNFVGGVGFTLCAIFGLYTAHWGQYQSALSTFWGGWAFLIGSVLQWYESVNSKWGASSEVFRLSYIWRYARAERTLPCVQYRTLTYRHR